MATKANPADQKLSREDQKVYAEIDQLLEHKQYTKIKTLVSKLLSTYPTNGELTCMQGYVDALIASPYDTNAHELAIKLMKQGLMWDLKNYRCWQINGLYYRYMRNYVDALKNYSQAIKLKPDDLSLLDETLFLMAQLGQWTQYAALRKNMIMNKDTQLTANWPGFAVSNHMAGNYQLALDTLESIIVNKDLSQLAETNPKTQSLPDTDVIMYRINILIEQGNYTEANIELDKYNNRILDRLQYNEMKGKVLRGLNHGKDSKNDDIKQLYRTMLDTNHEHLEYYQYYIESATGVNIIPYCHAINKLEHYDIIKNILDELQAIYPKSASLQKLALTIYKDNDFIIGLKKYIIPSLRRGVPSLFKSLRALYEVKENIPVIENVMITIQTSLETTNTFPEHDKVEITPTSLLSTYIYLAQHYAYIGNTQQALDILLKAEKHTPTFLDIYLLKAGIYKHAGNPYKAYSYIDYARTLDTADRYTNNKTVRYAYQAGYDDQGERTTALFIQDTPSIDAYQYGHQASWYFLSGGLSYATYKKNIYKTNPNPDNPESTTINKIYTTVGLALKKLASINDFFIAFTQSTYHYHTWVMRQHFLRAYNQLMVFCESVKKHKFNLRAILALVELLIIIAKRQSIENAKSQLLSINDADKQVILEKRNKDIEEGLSQRIFWQDKLNESLATSSLQDETPGATFNNPDCIDIYGIEQLNPTRSYLKDASKYILEILHAFNISIKHKLNKFEYKDKVLQPCDYNLATIYMSIYTYKELNKPLLCLQYLKQLQLYSKQLLSLFDGSSQPLYLGSTSKLSMIRQQGASSIWSQLTGIDQYNKIELYPYYIQAQQFIGEIVTSKALCDMKQHTDIIIQNSIDNVINDCISNNIIKSIQYDDIKLQLEDNMKYILTLSSISQRIMLLAGNIIAQAHSGIYITIPEFSLLTTPLDNTSNDIISSSSIRVALRALIYALNMISSQDVLQLPSITGVELDYNDDVIMKHPYNNIIEYINTVKIYGNSLFIHDIMFITDDNIVKDMKEKTYVEGPVYTQKSKKNKDKESKK